MLETMFRGSYYRSYNLVFVDDIIGYVTQEWWYTNGKKYLEDEGFRKEVSNLINE